VTSPLYLVRHGESEWNVLRLTQGQTMQPRLTSRGREQARQAAQRIADDLAASGLGADLVLTSDLARAVETAEILADVLGCELQLDARLREQHLGTLEGRSYDETFAIADTIDWSTADQPVAGGESLRQVYDRMAAVLASTDPGCVTILVSHGDAIRAALAHLQDVQPHRAGWVEVPNGAVARIARDAVIVWV